MIRLVFEPSLWPRAMALISSVWGIATLVGPAIGGVFAQFDIWRWAFYVLVPCSVALGLFAYRVVPRTSNERGMTRLPLPQIGLLIGAVAAISVASVLTGNAPVAAGLVLAAVAGIVAVGLIEQRTSVRLLPTGAVSLASPLAALFALMMLLQLGITSDIFIPLLMQQLHGLAPLPAAYLVALVAIGWSTASILTSGWTGARARSLIFVGPLVLAAGALGLALLVPLQPGGHPLTLGLIALSLIALGVGIGSAWQQINTRILHNAPKGEGDVTTAAISMAQQVATGLGAAMAGVIVNMAGLATGTQTGAASAAQWLYGLFLIAPLIAIPLSWRLVIREASGRMPAPAPAE
jgi:MFS family permease